MLLGDIPNGILLRQIEKKRAMMIGLGLIGLSTMCLFWTTSIFQAVLLRLAAGYGSSLYNVARHTYIADTITIATRGRSVALLGGTFRVGRFLGPVAGGSLAIAAGLRFPFILYCVVCFISIAVIGIFTRSQDQADQPGGAGASAHGTSFRSILATVRTQARMLTFPGLGHLLMQMVRAGPQVVIPLYASNVLGMDVQTIGLIFSISSAVDMTLFYPTGIIMDRLGRKFAIVPSASVMALGLLIIPFMHDLTGMILAGVIFGFGNGLGSGVMLTLGADLAPKETRGEFLGVWGLIGDSGTTGAPLLVGGVADLLALQPATWVIAGTGIAAALVFGLLVPETLKKTTKVPQPA